jgi:hypothetical protein
MNSRLHPETLPPEAYEPHLALRSQPHAAQDEFDEKYPQRPDSKPAVI